MRRAVNFLRGSVEVEASGPFPERFLNLCAQRGVVFWGVTWLESGAVRIQVPRHERRGLEELADRAGCVLTEVERAGVPAFLARFRRRYSLWVGLTLSVLAVLFLSHFVLVVDVQGNDRVPTAQILATLRRLGVHPGTFSPTIDVDNVEQEVLLELEELSWIAINRSGVRTEVLVRERVQPPEVVDEDELGDVVAQRDGVITRLEVLSGESDRKVGDPVAKEDVLIRGDVRLEGPVYGDGGDVGWQQVRAQGKIEARTWRTLEAAIPLEAAVKQETGDPERHFFIEWMGRRYDLFSWGSAQGTGLEKSARLWSPKLPDGLALPVVLGMEVLQGYETISQPVDLGAAEDLLRAQLEESLREQVGEGEIHDMSCTAVVQNGLLTVTLKAECVEEIGLFVPKSGDGT
ncbi:hypothetical protein B5E80_04285 [Flavonifractor sp. An135]|nr:sporulation protein YqfD [Flavonifractor sp. An135]OUQ25412.1 hypothetical protein B5E80_04285 [Flavonifractor sp. An135]